MLFLSISALAQIDTNLSWVIQQAALTEKLLIKYDYKPLTNSAVSAKDTAEFELKVNSKLYGTYTINGEIIMSVSKNKNLPDFNYRKVKEEQILMIINHDKKEYYMVYLYHLADGSVHPAWFRYLFSEARMMYDSLKDIIN
jgi:hypothetical protein